MSSSAPSPFCEAPLKPIDGDLSRTIVRLNDQEFIVGIGLHQIFKYNQALEEWTLFLDLPTSLNLDGRSMAVDVDKDRLYICGYTTNMLIINLKDNSVLHQGPTVFSDKTEVRVLRRPRRIGGDASMVNANGKIHKVGGAFTNRHVVWDETTSSWDDKEIDQDFEQKKGALLFVPSKNILLLIGGIFRVRDALGSVQAFNLGIWKFHLEAKQWQEVKEIRGRPTVRDAVLSNDEHHVIFTINERICILDIRKEGDYQWKKCSIIIPNMPANGWRLAKTGDKWKCQFVLSGLSRRQNIKIPVSILNLIATWCSPELIHLIGDDTSLEGGGNNGFSTHYVIPLVDILSASSFSKKKKK